jgi:PAS domain S-box-containing protein
LLARVLATMPDPVFVCDRSQQLLYINPLGAQSLGLEPRYVRQESLQAFDLPPDLKAQLAVQCETVFVTGRSISSDIRFTTSLYGLRDYEYTLSPILGTIEHIDAVLFSTKDVTERKRLEAALKASEANYQNLFESTNDSILILDALTRRLLNANTNASKRLGYTRQELFQLNIDAILPQWSADVTLERSQWLQTLDTDLFNHYLRHKNGTHIPVEIHSRLIEYGDQLAIQSFIREPTRAKSQEVDPPLVP